MNNIRKIRKSLNIKIQAVADYLGVTTMAIYLYENGKRKISVENLKKLSRLYNCTINDLID